MNIPMELARIVISENTPEQVIVLREKGGSRTFPILIGITEALAIDRRLKGVHMPRPMTHDLLAGVIDGLGATIDRIVIRELRDATFFATIVLARDGQLIEIDARPSDAIALGVANDTPLFVAERVLDEVLRDASEMFSRKNLTARRDRLRDEIAGLREQLGDDGFQAEVSAEQLSALRLHVREMESELEAIEEILRQLP